MEDTTRTLLKSNLSHTLETQTAEHSSKNGSVKRVLVYFILTQGGQVEKDLLESTYQQFRARMNNHLHSNIFPEKATSKITTTNPGLLEQVSNRFNEVIERDDGNYYFFLVLDGALTSYEFLHPTSPKVLVLEVENNKLDELYEKGRVAIKKMSESIAS